MTSSPSQAGAPPTLILFDCDGTLVDSQHMIVSAMEDAHAAEGLEPPSRGRILSVVGLSLPEAFAVLSDGRGDYPAAALVEGYKLAFQRLRSASPPEPMFPGAFDVLRAYVGRDDVLLGMVTGKARRGVNRIVDAYGMHGWFATIQTADDAPSKPHPAMVMQAMAEVGARPEDTVVVGDTTYDVTMALAAGAAALGVSWGYHRAGDLLGAGAHLLVDRFVDVPAAVSGLVAERRAAQAARERA